MTLKNKLDPGLRLKRFLELVVIAAFRSLPFGSTPQSNAPGSDQPSIDTPEGQPP